jgi:hypothetical protein
MTAVPALLLGYGWFGDPELAVESPSWATYCILRAPRAVTGSAQRAGLAVLAAGLQYGAVVWFFASCGLLTVYASPLVAIGVSGTSTLDEFAKMILMVLSGIVVMYATSWNEKTLRQSGELM